MKLNLGSGNVPLKGYTSVDLVPPADVVGDFLEMSFAEVEAVEMSHVLEHISFRDTEAALRRVLSWMVPEGTLRVEVPDCAELVKMDPAAPEWNQWMFGAQGEEGQYHRVGFVAETLEAALLNADWTVVGTRTFVSDNPNRVGYPCLEATACA
jgi:predicted SAM-dependent methyltransferase